MGAAGGLLLLLPLPDDDDDLFLFFRLNLIVLVMQINRQSIENDEERAGVMSMKATNRRSRKRIWMRGHG
jgi:hypothetical protein